MQLGRAPDGFAVAETGKNKIRIFNFLGQSYVIQVSFVVFGAFSALSTFFLFLFLVFVIFVIFFIYLTFFRKNGLRSKAVSKRRR